MANSEKQWVTIKFKNFVQLQRGFDLPQQNRKSGKYPVVASTSITAHHDEFKVKAPCITTGRSGALGEVLYVNEDCWPLNTTLWVKDFKNNDPKFIYYKLKTLGLEKFNAGAGVPTLNRNHLDELSIKIPAKKETQSRIAFVLSAYDDLIENNEKRIKMLEEMAQRLYTEWFVKFKFPGHEKIPMIDSGTEYGMIPKGWEVKRLDEVIRIVRGRSYSSEQISDTNGEYYIVNLKSFNRGGGFRSSGAKYYSGPVSDDQLLRQGDIVVAVTDMTNDRAVIARPARIPNITTHKTMLSADVVKIVTDEIASSFIYYCLLDHRFTEATKQKANGANVLHLKPSAIAEYRALIPMDQLLKQFDNLCTPSFDLIDKMMAQNADLEKIRDLLIPQLVTGNREL
jgi:type I restriction enzyme S subunit